MYYICWCVYMVQRWLVTRPPPPVVGGGTSWYPPSMWSGYWFFPSPPVDGGCLFRSMVMGQQHLGGIHACHLQDNKEAALAMRQQVVQHSKRWPQGLTAPELANTEELLKAELVDEPNWNHDAEWSWDTFHTWLEQPLTYATAYCIGIFSKRFRARGKLPPKLCGYDKINEQHVAGGFDHTIWLPPFNLITIIFHFLRSTPPIASGGTVNTGHDTIYTWHDHICAYYCLLEESTTAILNLFFAALGQHRRDLVAQFRDAPMVSA